MRVTIYKYRSRFQSGVCSCTFVPMTVTLCNWLSLSPFLSLVCLLATEKKTGNREEEDDDDNVCLGKEWILLDGVHEFSKNSVEVTAGYNNIALLKAGSRPRDIGQGSRETVA